ncbi:MAG: hypothetical protein ACPW61_07185 [Methyloligella sp. ZOD6]
MSGESSPKTGTKNGETRPAKDDDRAERLAAELRANLARRKAQKKARRQPDSPDNRRQSEE